MTIFRFSDGNLSGLAARVIHAASHFDHKERVAWVPISMHTCGSFSYNYGAPLGDPSGRRSSAIKVNATMSQVIMGNDDFYT